MAWTINFNQDTDAKGVGTATTNYVGEAADVGITFNLSTRLDTNDGASIDAFLDEALATLEKYRATKTERNAVVDKLTTILNGKTV